MHTYSVFTARTNPDLGIPANLFVMQVDAPDPRRARRSVAEQMGITSEYLALTLFSAQRADDPRAQGQEHIKPWHEARLTYLYGA